LQLIAHAPALDALSYRLATHDAPPPPPSHLRLCLRIEIDQGSRARGGWLANSCSHLQPYEMRQNITESRKCTFVSMVTNLCSFSKHCARAVPFAALLHVYLLFEPRAIGDSQDKRLLLFSSLNVEERKWLSSRQVRRERRRQSSLTSIAVSQGSVIEGRALRFYEEDILTIVHFRLSLSRA
jgi:hypothetical protein